MIIEGVELINGDISSIKTLPEVDFVIHAASSTKMEDYNSNNFGKNYVEKAVSNYCDLSTKFHLKSRILYCSSGAVYGKQPLDIIKIREDFNFKKDLSDLTIEKQNYCLMKRYAENKIINLGKLGLNVSIARCFAFYGNYLPKDQHFAYGNFLRQAEKGEKVVAEANGVVYRSYMHADDLVTSLMKILILADASSPIYNVGSDEAVSLYDLAKKIAIQHNVDYEFPNYSNIILDRYVPNTDKLKELF